MIFARNRSPFQVVILIAPPKHEGYPKSLERFGNRWKVWVKHQPTRDRFCLGMGLEISVFPRNKWVGNGWNICFPLLGKKWWGPYSSSVVPMGLQKTLMRRRFWVHVRPGSNEISRSQNKDPRQFRILILPDWFTTHNSFSCRRPFLNLPNLAT